LDKMAIRTVLCVGVAWLVCVGCSSNMRSQRPVVEVWLGEPIESVRKRSAFSGALGDLSLKQPCTIRVHLCDESVYGTDTSSVVVSEKDGVVRHVSITPLERTIDYQEAIQKAEGIIAELVKDNDMKYKGDKESPIEIANTIKKWKENTDPVFAVSIMLNSEPFKASGFLEIKPYDVTETHRKQWYIVLTLSSCEPAHLDEPLGKKFDRGPEGD